MGGFHYWKGGDDDPRDQVGVDPTTPAHGNAEPVHPVWGYPFPGAGPPDLDHAIQAATDALVLASAAGGFLIYNRKADGRAIARVAVEAAAPVLLQATRDQLAEVEAKVQRLREALIAVGHPHLLAVLDGPAAQEEDDQVCDACGELFTHDPQCGYLADSYRDGTEGRQ